MANNRRFQIEIPAQAANEEVQINNLEVAENLLNQVENALRARGDRQLIIDRLNQVAEILGNPEHELPFQNRELLPQLKRRFNEIVHAHGDFGILAIPEAEVFRGPDLDPRAIQIPPDNDNEPDEERPEGHALFVIEDLAGVEEALNEIEAEQALDDNVLRLYLDEMQDIFRNEDFHQDNNFQPLLERYNEIVLNNPGLGFVELNFDRAENRRARR